MEKQNTKIIKDQKQTRTTIPAKLVKEAGVETGHIAEWELKEGKLSASVMSHKDFMKKVKHETSLPVEVGKYVNEDCQSKSDLSQTKNQIGHGKRDAVYTEGESK